MRIIKRISSITPSKCGMVAKGFFGKVYGEVRFDWHTGSGYQVVVGGKITGSASDFFAACDMLLGDLKVVKTICA